MPTPPPQFKEEYSAKLPALILLNHLGWQYITPKQALSAREGKRDEVVLRDELRHQLQKRRFLYGGVEYPLSEKSIDTILSEVCQPALNEGLKLANEKLYNHFIYGITVSEFIAGKKVNPTIPLIDWQTPENNRFLVCDEFEVLATNHIDTRRPDLVCFINGLPLVVIEAKRPDGQLHKGPTINEGISQSLRNQRPNEIPHLFAYSQLLLSINGSQGRYATQGTAAKFWATWREEAISDEEMAGIKNRPLSADDKQNLFGHRKAQALDWYKTLTTGKDLAGGNLAITEQDQLLISLLSPKRLLEITQLFILFDRHKGKMVARYQQFFAIKCLIRRINQYVRDDDKGRGREGGVIWHTTGSGKSLTMVFLSKALIMHPSLKQCRLVLVTDRNDLEDQLSATFVANGELASDKDKSVAMATSGKRLAKQIATGRERIIFSLIQKFNSATQLAECYNESPNIIVLIDEGHRSQGGENHMRMKQALPHAALVAFTGTPLLKKDKTTHKFGSIIHAYTMQRAVEDKAITPLLYEQRIPDLAVNSRAIDSWFNRITEGLTQAQKAEFKKKFSKQTALYQSEDRIRLIALDLANHFIKNIDEGLKGQLACDSKQSAIKYKQVLDQANLFETALVMSAPDSREGNTAVDGSAEDELNTPEVVRWWQENVGTQSEKDYTKSIIERFEKDDRLKLLIVVDKLLTGFDEPQNTVLYIDKPLKEHNLIQAIARVNRLHTQKQFGYLIDYRGILAELDTTIAKYQDLASRTQGGYDIDDLAGLYHPMSTEYKRLPQLYKNLWAIFSGVKNKQDIEQLRQVLVPHIQEVRVGAGGGVRHNEVQGELVDTHLKIREDFYEALSQFARCLKVALQSANFYQDKRFSDKDRSLYKETLKQFSSLRQLVKADCGDSLNHDDYNHQIKKLMDKHVVGVAVKDSKGIYEVGKMGIPLISEATPEQWSEEKTRNETDIIKTRIAKMIEQQLGDDPYAQEAFSKLLRQTIAELEKRFEHSLKNPLKQYLHLRQFEAQVKARKLADIPDCFGDNQSAQAYYGAFKKVLPETFAQLDEAAQNQWIQLAHIIDKQVEQSVTENSINQHNIEADIRVKLLPELFKHCKSVGAGINQANAIIEYVVQITRIGRRL